MADDDPGLALAEFSQVIAREILTQPELAEPEWDTYALVAEVSDFSVGMTAYRYTESGPPVPTRPPENSYPFIQLRQRTRGHDGAAWDVVIIKIHRDTVNLVMNFVSGEAADLWRVNPGNIGRLPEALRPRKEDFLGDDPGLEVEQQLPQAAPAPAPVSVPVHTNQDVNLVIGDRTNTGQTAAAWPTVSQHDQAVWTGSAVEGAPGLLVRALNVDEAKRTILYEPIDLVRMRNVTRREDGGYQARPEPVEPLSPDDVVGLISRTELRDLLQRAAERDPAFVTGWQRPTMRAPHETAELPLGAVADDLLQRLPMPLSSRIELMTLPGRERFQALLDQVRDIADGTPPQPQTAQRLRRPPVDLPSFGVPVLAADIWLTPGNVSTITASLFICEKAFAAGWLAFTKDLTVGRAAMLTRPLQRSETVNANGYYSVTVDQICPAIVRAVVPGEAGRSLLELGPAPSAAEAAGHGLPEPREERDQLSAYVDLLRRAYARDRFVVGTASGTAYRLWQAGRFTSLQALMSWQIGQLGFGAQAVIDLQAIAWPERLRALTTVLQAVADGRPLKEAVVEATELAASALT